MNLKVLNKPTWDGWDHWEDDFHDFFSVPSLYRRKREFSPACDFHENDKHYFFSLDVPGVKKEDLHIEYMDGVLTISGEKKNEYRKEGQKPDRYAYEKFYGSFKKAFHLPTSIDERAIETRFQNGVLELLIPKAEAKKSRQIPINEGEGKNLFAKILKPVKKEA